MSLLRISPVKTTFSSINMAAGGDFTLNGEDVVKLAATIAANDMKMIAEGYMDIASETIKNIQFETGWDAEAFNREIIRLWANKNSGSKQVKVILTLQRLDLLRFTPIVKRLFTQSTTILKAYPSIAMAIGKANKC